MQPDDKHSYNCVRAVSGDGPDLKSGVSQKPRGHP